MSASMKGKNTWSKGKRFSAGHKLKISLALKGRPSHFKGKRRSEEFRRHLSEIQKGKRCHFWKGGIDTEHHKIRNSLEYKLWRTAVFERDKYTCVWCGNKKSGNLQADHIKPFAYYPEFRFAIDNGRTLCKECHKTTDTWGHKAHKFIQK